MRFTLKLPGLCLLALFSLLQANPSSAQTLYRCGKAYQDRPCEGTEGQVIGTNKSPPVTTAGSQPSDARCLSLGNSAKELRWQKEGGKTEEQQIAAGSYSAEFIKYVYAKRGTAQEVKTSVETDCMADRERASAQPKAGNVPPPNATQQPVPSPAQVQPAAPDKSDQCQRLAAEDKDLQERQRRGGTAAVMERLAEDRRQLSRRRSSAGC